jgi:hypothetical protein
MTPFATLPMWSDATERRSCQIHVYEGRCTVDLRTADRPPLTLACTTLSDAFQEAEMLRSLYSPESHIHLGDISRSSPQAA